MSTKQNKMKNLVPSTITTLMIVWAYTFAGAPVLIFGEINDTCNLCQNTTYFLNKNPLGEWLSQTMYDLHANKNTSYQFEPQNIDIFLKFREYHPPESYSLKNNKLWISENLKNGVMFEEHIITRGGQKIVVELNHESKISHPVALIIHGKQFPVSYADENKTIWEFMLRESQQIHYILSSISEQDYSITGLSISMHDEFHAKAN